MTNSDEYTMLLFPSINHVLKAEKLLAERDVPNKLIPVPRSISSNCGVCIRIFRKNREEAVSILSLTGMEMPEMHDL